MNPKKIEEKLYQRRKFLVLCKEYKGDKMNNTQSGYSSIEKGKVKFSDELLSKIKAIDGFADFDAETPEPEVKADRLQMIRQIWPWSSFSLKILLIIIALLLLEQAYQIVVESYYGINAGLQPDPSFHTSILFVFLMPLALLIWFYRPKKK